MKSALFIAALIIAALGGGYYFMFNPNVVYQRACEKTLHQFAETIATKDRPQIAGAFDTFLTDDARIGLEVDFFSLSRPNGNPGNMQEFDKETFKTFIDNVLYPLTDYSYQPTLTSFKLASDHKTAAVTFESKEWADGSSYYGGMAVGVRFSSETSCEGEVVFEEKTPRLSHASCKIQMRNVPKPGQEDKLRSPEALRDLIR